MSYKEKVFLAREFRKNPTRSEHIFWQTIRAKQVYGYRFRKQHVIEGYILDFYCPKLHLAIEIDGGVHLSNIESDKERMMILEKIGIKFFRVSAELVENDLEEVINNLEKYILNLK